MRSPQYLYPRPETLTSWDIRVPSPNLRDLKSRSRHFSPINIISILLIYSIKCISWITCVSLAFVREGLPFSRENLLEFGWSVVESDLDGFLRWTGLEEYRSQGSGRTRYRRRGVPRSRTDYLQIRLLGVLDVVRRREEGHRRIRHRRPKSLERSRKKAGRSDTNTRKKQRL